jgi:hypothetical protein
MLEIISFRNAYQDNKLKDVHVTLTTRGLEDGQRYTIYGSYIYYHYLQDSFNDKGWGCAYRSLQTLVSWFLEQRYVKPIAVPSITEIQQILVELGDKEPNFVGSQEWIGAFECSLVLNKLFDIDSKILFIQNGGDILSHSKELKAHFEEEGTPVMIGGGVLAYTLLGIDYDENSGDTKYLILDPHYTGSDTLKNIQEKGWIAWKEPKIFLEGSFYNLCLPQRPRSL